MDNRPIGIFDSGVGGLTAVRQLRLAAPEESYIFFGDNLRAPYGDRTAEDIQFLSRRNARFLRAQGVKALIVACNTSTANAMAELTADNADIPTAGTIAPSAVEAVRRTAEGRIGVIATAATIRSGAFARAIRELLPSAEVVSQSCPRLVPLIEAGHTAPGDPALMEVLREDLAPLKEARVDTLVLGCTHYPLAGEAIQEVLERDVAMVDSGAASVGTVLEALRARDGRAAPGGVGSERYYCSARPASFADVARGFLGWDIAGCVSEVDVTAY